MIQVLDAGVHFGHKAYRWNQKMFPYIYTERNNIHILVSTICQLLKKQILMCNHQQNKGKHFVYRTKRQASALIAQEAKRCNSYYVNHRWLGGMLTNWVTLKVASHV